MKVLLADDDRRVRAMAKQVIESDGHEAIIASTALEALRFVLEDRPSVIILDGLMPQMHLRQHGPDGRLDLV